MQGLTINQIGDFQNTPIFPGEENWLGFRARLSFPSSQGSMPASRLQTVFSITQSDQSIPHIKSSVATIFDMLTRDVFDKISRYHLNGSHLTTKLS